MCLKLLTVRSLSKAAGSFMDSRCSKWIIPIFRKATGIDLNDFEKEDYKCFNDFFKRKIKAELRPLEEREEYLASPSDGLLRIYPISGESVIPVKESAYNIPSLLQDAELASEYEDGICMVFRLCVNHYHRYHFPDGGSVLATKKIDGVLHTVSPIALRELPVFTENAREYTVMETENFGKVVMMEVGAMLVGRISNHDKTKFNRGEEKGYFEYGGSPVILLLKKDRVELPRNLYIASEKGYETHVKMGQAVAKKI